MKKEVLERVRKTIRSAQAKLSELEQDAIDAKRAGIVTTDLDKQIADFRTQIRKLRSVYGPA